MAHKDKSSDTAKKIAIGGTLAAVAGFVAGILTAPKSGKETRGDIKAAADRSMAEGEKELKRLHTELDKVIADAKGRGNDLSAKAQKELTQLTDKAKDTKEKVREVLSALHEGDAEDQDLKRAIKNANSALEHLNDYLKK